MEYERSTSTLAKNAKKTTLIWGNDGWCYLPELKMRQRFTETKYYHEDWDGIIAMPEYVETTYRTVLSKEPLVWQEGNEVFSVKKSTNKKRSLPPQRFELKQKGAR